MGPHPGFAVVFRFRLASLVGAPVPRAPVPGPRGAFASVAILAQAIWAQAISAHHAEAVSLAPLHFRGPRLGQRLRCLSVLVFSLSLAGR